MAKEETAVPRRLYAAVAAFLSLYSTVHTMAAEQAVVRGVDLQRYSGRWYQIAAFPSVFQPKSGVDTRATYGVNPNGTLSVLNEVWVRGKRSSIQGIAYKADPKSDEAKLKVKFKVPPALPLISVVGDYWILDLDDQYQHALVGHPTRLFLWILNRKTRLDDAIYNQLVQKAKEEGYDVSKLQKTVHSDTPPEGEEA